MKNTRLYLILLALIVLTPTAWAQGLSGSGTTDDPYLITSADDWNTFAQSVTNGITYAGQFVQLDADITMSVMAGSHTGESNYHAFSGTFDGDGHTITLALSGSGEGTALFSDLEGATLKNLKAQGTVTTNKNRPATFAAFVFGNSTISNCWSTVAVSSTKTNSWVDGGGFVARVSSNDTLNMIDCAFHGSVTYDATSYSGGSMVGFTQTDATVYLTNCLYSPTALVLTLSAYNPHVFVSGDVRGTLSNCYYNAVAKASILENEGTDASNMSNEDLAAALGAGWHVYNNMVVPFTGTYYISSAAEWNAFATTVNNGTSYSGQTVALTTDIPTAITTMAGTDSHPFCGTFDGDGHTITLALSGNGPGTALFYLIEGATLKNLKVQGTVTTTGYRPATFAAFVEGNSTISNCWCTVAVSSTKTNSWVDGGGFVGRVSGTATLNMAGCAFHGSVTFTPTATTGGGMVGFTQTGAVVNLTDCLYSPTTLTLNVSQYNPRIFVSGDVAGNLTNCYYNDVAADSELGKQGKLMHSITAGDYVTVAFDGEATTYDMSGISAYNVGLVYDSTLYAGQGETVSLNLACTPPPGYTYGSFSASAGTLNGTENPYTLTMPNEDVTIVPGYIVSVVCTPNIAGAAQVSLDNTNWSSSVNAAVGQEVYFKANAVMGYNLTSYTIETENGNPVYFANGHFTMPAANVTYYVDFSPNPAYIDNYTVTLSPGLGEGEPIVYTFDPATAAPNAATADICQFYYVNYNTLGFRLGDDCPNSFTAPEGLGFSGWNNSGYVTLTSQEITFTAQWGNPGSPVNYIDGNGEIHTLHYYTVLTGSETELDAGWYAVDHDITYDSTLTLNGDVTLILCNDKTMTVTATRTGIKGNNHSLTIYGQSLDPNVAGTLNITISGRYNAIYDLNYTQHSGNVVASSPISTAIHIKDFTINGGNLQASGKYDGISTINGGDLTINGGTVTATSHLTNSNVAGLSSEGNVIINGGKVETNKIFAGYNITLGYTHPDDYILAGEYYYNYFNNGGTMAVKSGQSFYYENEGQNVIVSGTIANPNSTIAGKTLLPYGLATYTLTPTAYTLTNDGYTDIPCTLSSLELLEVWNGSSMVPATGLSFYMNGGTLTDSIGNSIPFLVDNGSHSGAAARKAQGGVFSSEGDTLIMAVYIDPEVYDTLAPGIYTGIFDYDSYWNENPNIHGLSGSIALTLEKSESSTVTQTVALSAGANYVSFYVETTLADLKAALAAAAPNANISIKSQTQTTTYNPNNHRWTGNITLDLAKMYIINVSTAIEISLEGMPINPAEHPITITGNGTTYLGFPFSTSMMPTDAFAGFAVQGDKLKNQSSTCPYNRGHWGTQIPALEPGKGYKYISNDSNDRVLTYPTSKK